ncbi:zinc-finger domain-containing protein [Stappia indica]|uniref:zinc-finger domain-containing protein n=1 Tax=Stappia indica TaxID=538381 RepID=UPI001CD4C834|nr:zinc-finger domain-containing protein [Stappia indica]MCA1300041.1 zinc-finger domain-containing protein [Stappia indica]
MADGVVPHFQNDRGIEMIEVGAKEFQCIGARPPFDHPHVYLDMGHETEIVCPYCSTLYRFNPKLDAGAAEPADCVWTPKAA